MRIISNFKTDLTPAGYSDIFTYKKAWDHFFFVQIFLFPYFMGVFPRKMNIFGV